MLDVMEERLRVVLEGICRTFSEMGIRGLRMSKMEGFRYEGVEKVI